MTTTGNPPAERVGAAAQDSLHEPRPWGGGGHDARRSVPRPAPLRGHHPHPHPHPLGEEMA